MKKEAIQNGEVLGTSGRSDVKLTAQFNTNTEYEIDVLKEKTESDKETYNVTSNRNNTSHEVVGLESVATIADSGLLLPAFLGSYPNNHSKMIINEQAEVILGADERIRISSPTAYPWRTICALRIRASNGSTYVGTGWLISPRTVITAGHCVYLHEAGGWASSIEVIPALNDSSRPYNSAVSTNLRSVKGWTDNKNRDYDYGCIILPSNSRLGESTGYFGFAVRDDNFLSNAALNLCGYPADKGSTQQWFMAQRPKSVSPRVITYNIDTYGGQSGSPVWILQNGNRYAVGIHTNGAQTGNSATRIVTGVYNNMLMWRDMGL